MRIEVAPSDIDLSEATVIVGIHKGLVPAVGSESWFAESDEAVLIAASFEGDIGQSVVVSSQRAHGVLMVGLGDEIDFAGLRNAAGNAVRSVKTDQLATTLHQVDIEDATRAVVEGFVLGSYKFLEFKTTTDPKPEPSALILDGDGRETEEAYAVALNTNKARDWINTPANIKSPEWLATEFRRLLEEAEVEVEIWGRQQIESRGLGALMGVAAGSARDPQVVISSYRPEGAVSHIGLVGKGITFDSGGLSIKPAKSMEEMKTDMAGAAAVTAAVAAIASLGLPVNVTGITPITDNVIGSFAARPGDVLRPMTGPRIEVLNTDAEGRLILADGLSVIKDHNPDVIVDVATLTGRQRVGLGDKIGAVFARGDGMADRMLNAGSVAGEPFWEMPLFDGYRKSLESDVADIKNSVGPYGSPITAALFLSHFVDAENWIHLDIAGPARGRESSGDSVTGGQGFGVRTLVAFARGLVETPISNLGS